MNEYDILNHKIEELALFLSESGQESWAEHIRCLVTKSEVQIPLQELKREVRNLFGAMGSLTDIYIYFEDDPQRTESANMRLDQLMGELFDLVKEEERQK